MAGLIYLLLAGFAGPAAAPPLTAEQAFAAQQRGLEAALGTAPCARDIASGDILVCGRPGREPYRLPLPVEPEPGARRPGEAAAPSEALALGAERCTAVGPNPRCGGGLPVIPIAIWLVQTAVKAAQGED
ncbi:MAG TPA: hypothetical protein VEA61_04735 [Allosphingosinicella sp.]|nr:hypothetical protein [Allosphingosinicella sp.]